MDQLVTEVAWSVSVVWCCEGDITPQDTRGGWGLEVVGGRGCE